MPFQIFKQKSYNFVQSFEKIVRSLLNYLPVTSQQHFCQALRTLFQTYLGWAVCVQVYVRKELTHREV